MRRRNYWFVSTTCRWETRRTRRETWSNVRYGMVVLAIHVRVTGTLTYIFFPGDQQPAIRKR